MVVIEEGMQEPRLTPAVEMAARLASEGVLTSERVRQLADEFRLPARTYAAFRTAVARLVTELDVSPSGDEAESDQADDNDDLGWDADGFGEFLAKTKHEVLTAEDERHLAQQIELGELARQALESSHDLSPDVTRDLRQRVLEGERAFEAFMLSNMRLVVSVAAKHQNRGVELEDLVQEGFLGLRRAVEKFDHRLGFKFSTYATWWIRQSISRAIDNQCSTVRLPVHLRETIRRVRAARRRLASELQRTPSITEIATDVGMSERDVQRCFALAKSAVSLDAPLRNGWARRGDCLEGEEPIDFVARSLMVVAVREALSGLSERDREVLSLRFGLADGRTRTLEEIGQAFGVTRERIRQIEAKALQRLRQPPLSETLRDFVQR